MTNGVYEPSEADTTAVAHAVTEDLAGNNVVADEDRVQLLTCVRYGTSRL